MNPTGDISHYQGIPSFCPENSIANAQIRNRRDRIAWCIGVICQREISIPGCICFHRTLPEKK